MFVQPSPAQGCSRLSSAREQQRGSSLARANEEGVSPVSEQKILRPLISHSLFASCRGHLDRHHIECRLEWGICHFISLLLFMVLDRHTQPMGRVEDRKPEKVLLLHQHDSYLPSVTPGQPLLTLQTLPSGSRLDQSLLAAHSAGTP